MARSSKSLTLARLEDLTLGAFAAVPMSNTFKHLVDYLSTWGGTEKTFAVLQYALKLLVPFLQWRARLQHRMGRRAAPTSDAAPNLSKLAGYISEARTLFSFLGMLPIIRWLISIERNPPPTRKLLTIERLQAWSLLLFYPLDHMSYLVSHSVVPEKTSLPLLSRNPSITSQAADGTISLDAGKMSRLSCRFWAIYIVMQIAHLREDRRILLAEERSLGKSKAISAQAAKAKIRERWQFIWTELLANLCNLPCALHWSSEKGLIKNDVWVNALAFTAAVISWQSGWKATAIAISPPAIPPPVTEGELDEEKSTGVTDLDIQAPIGLDAGLDEI